jgi:homoserine acetyltransferase
MISTMSITTKVVSSNPVQGEVHSIQHYVTKFVSDLTCRWFSPGTLVSITNKTNSHDITEILLTVALNTINQPTFTKHQGVRR